MPWFVNNVLIVHCVSAGRPCPGLGCSAYYTCIAAAPQGLPCGVSSLTTALVDRSPSSAAASLGTDPGPAAPWQPRGVPDCPAMWAHARWPGQLLSTRGTHRSAALAGGSLLAATWCSFSAHTRASLPNCTSLPRYKFKDKI